MTPLYASAAFVVWGLVVLRGGSVTSLVLRLSLWLRTCAVYAQAVVAAVRRDHAELWKWSREKVRREASGV